MILIDLVTLGKIKDHLFCREKSLSVLIYIDLVGLFMQLVMLGRSATQNIVYFLLEFYVLTHYVGAISI